MTGATSRATAAAVAAFALAAAASAADADRARQGRRSRPSPAAASGACEHDLRGGAGRHLGHLGLHRRHRGEADLRAGLGTGGTGHAEAVEVDYDPSQGHLPAAARHLLAQHRPARRQGPVLRPAATSTAPRSSTTTTSSSGWPRPRRRRSSRPQAASAADDRDRDRAGRAVLPGRGLPPGLLKKNPVRYNFYRWNCGRDQRLTELWGADAVGAKVASTEPPKQ